MKVLALDIAGNLGWSVVSDTGVEAFGSANIGLDIRTRSRATKSAPAMPENARDALKMKRVREKVARLLQEFPDVGFVVVEKDTTQGKAAVTLARLQVGAHEAALDAGIPSVSVQLTSWRRRIHGDGYTNSTDAMKSAALCLCRDAGHDVPDADAAEAVLIGKDAIAVGLEKLLFDEAHSRASIERKAVKARKAAREAKKAAAAAAPAKRRRAA